MKVVPYDWQEVDAGEWRQGPQGRLRLQLTGKAPIFIRTQGYEVCATVASSALIEVAEAYEYMVDGPVRVFVHEPHIPEFEHLDEVFTNADQLPVEGGHMAEMKRMMRSLQMQQQVIRREAAEASALHRGQINAARSRREAVAEEDQEAEADDTAES